MYRLSVKNDKGEVINLSSSKDYTVYKIDGLNPPKININSSVNSTQDGGVINSVRMDTRNLVLYMTIDGDVEVNRINLYKYFHLKSLLLFILVMDPETSI